jgi:hypothetical protein
MRAWKFKKIGKFFPQVFTMAVVFKMAENLIFKMAKKLVFYHNSVSFELFCVLFFLFKLVFQSDVFHTGFFSQIQDGVWCQRWRRKFKRVFSLAFFNIFAFCFLQLVCIFVSSATWNKSMFCQISQKCCYDPKWQIKIRIASC